MSPQATAELATRTSTPPEHTPNSHPNPPYTSPNPLTPTNPSDPSDPSDHSDHSDHSDPPDPPSPLSPMQIYTTGTHALLYAPISYYTRVPSPPDALWREFTLCKLEANPHPDDPAACLVAQALARSAPHVTIDHDAIRDVKSRAALRASRLTAALASAVAAALATTLAVTLASAVAAATVAATTLATTLTSTLAAALAAALASRLAAALASPCPAFSLLQQSGQGALFELAGWLRPP